MKNYTYKEMHICLQEDLKKRFYITCVMQGRKMTQVVIELILGKMHKLKEEFSQIFEQNTDWLEGLFSLGSWLHSAAKYFPSSQKTIKRWLGEIIAYFDNRTTSGFVEGINNKLKLILRPAYGFMI